jgi:hypothetical protein
MFTPTLPISLSTLDGVAEGSAFFSVRQASRIHWAKITREIMFRPLFLKVVWLADAMPGGVATWLQVLWLVLFEL